MAIPAEVRRPHFEASGRESGEIAEQWTFTPAGRHEARLWPQGLPRVNLADRTGSDARNVPQDRQWEDSEDAAMMTDGSHLLTSCKRESFLLFLQVF